MINDKNVLLQTDMFQLNIKSCALQMNESITATTTNKDTFKQLYTSLEN